MIINTEIDNSGFAWRCKVKFNGEIGVPRYTFYADEEEGEIRYYKPAESGWITRVGKDKYEYTIVGEYGEVEIIPPEGLTREEFEKILCNI